MVKREFDKSEALKTVALLMKSDDKGLADMAVEINARLRRPMADILKKVPGKSISAKAARCGVSRQCFYDWMKGVYRPTGEQSRRIAKVTGIPLAHVEGKGAKPPKKRTKKAPAPTDEGAVA